MSGFAFLGRRGWLAEAAKPAVGFAIALAAWWVVSARSSSVYEVPSPWEVVVVLKDLGVKGVLGPAALNTMKVFLSGWAISVVLGVVVGAVTANSIVARGLLTPLFELMRPVPSVAVIPLAIVLFGLGSEMKILVTVYASIWPVYLTAADALHRVDPVLVAVSRQFGLRTRWRYFLRVQLPSAVPRLVAAARTSSVIALALTIVSEIVSTGGGLGNWIIEYEQALRVPEMYACILTVAALGGVTHGLLVVAERHVARWAPRIGQ